MTNLTREQIDCLAETPWNAYDLANIHKDSLAALVSMARELLELRERAKGSAEELAVRLMTECTKEVKGYDAEKASHLIEAWHEAQLPVVTEDARKFSRDLLYSINKNLTPHFFKRFVQKIAARDASLLSSYKESVGLKWRWSYDNDDCRHLLMVGDVEVAEIYEDGDGEGPPTGWAVSDLIYQSFGSSGEYDKCKAECEKIGDAFIASLSTSITEDGGEK